MPSLLDPPRSDARRRHRSRACARSRSSWPRRGGSRTPSRRPRPRAAAPPPSSPGASSSPTPSCFAAVRAARDGSPPRRRRSAAAPPARRCSTTRFVPHQVPADLRRAIVELETRVESTFNNFRGHDRRPAASTTTRSPRSCAPATTPTRAAAAWEASKQIGPEVADRIRELARLRNQAARDARRPRPLRPRARHRRARRGAPVRHARRRRPRHRGTVRGVEARRRRPTGRRGSAARIDELRPWHYDDPFFQSPPAEGAVAIDHFFADADLEALTVRTYDGLGLDVRTVLDQQRPLRTRRQEPARVLHRHRPRRRRARALQRGAQRALDGHDAPRVRPRHLRPRVRPRPPVAGARRRARAHHRGHRHADGPPAPRPGVAARGRRRSTDDDVDAIAARARATRAGPRCSCSPAGCW